MASLLLAAGCGCLIVVALTHVAERFSILPAMGWGLPNSPGHYLNLCCAVAGIVLLLTAGIVRLLRSNRPTTRRGARLELLRPCC